MPMIPCRETTIRYIMKRRCESGGYCFYRLDEPNAGDTFYALASLAILQALPRGDEATRTYLHSFQQPDGSFTNVNVGHAVIRSLALAGERPAANPSAWILSSLQPPDATGRPVESSSLFEPLFQLTALCRLLRIGIPESKRDEIKNAVYRYRHGEGGFGYPRSTIIETAHALAVLAVTGDSSDPAPAEKFLQSCEDPVYGFLAVPGARPPFLEHIHTGILACSVLGYRPVVLEQCGEFIRKCCRENGGYVRSVFGGSATLENTYFALDSLRMLEHIGTDLCLREQPSLKCCD